MAKRHFSGKVRLVGGKWRGRILPFADLPGLRPTPDRLKVTLFNWLLPALPGARCLDAFSGTGSLGFECISRGASAVDMIEIQPQAVRILHRCAAELNASEAQIQLGDAHSFVSRGACLPSAPYDIVLLDPPFDWELPPSFLSELSLLLRPEALIYHESPLAAPLPETPASWTLHKSAKAGKVAGRLWLHQMQ